MLLQSATTQRVVSETGDCPAARNGPVPTEHLRRSGVEPLVRERWQDRAACAGVDIRRIYPEIEDPEGEKTMLRFSKQYCKGCAVRVECLNLALDYADEFGVFGGFLPFQGPRA